MADDIKVIKNERGIGTGEARTGVEPRPDANGQIEPHGSARNAGIVSDPARDAPRDVAGGKTPGASETGLGDLPERAGPGKTPGKAEG